MPLIDNRPTTSGPTGGGDILATKNAIKDEWKVVELPVNGLDLANGYVTLLEEPQDTKVLVSLLGVGPLDNGVDFTIDKPNLRINFEPDLLARMTTQFAVYGTLTVKAAYFKIN